MARAIVGLKLLFFIYIFSSSEAQPRHNDPCLWHSNLRDPLRSTFQQPRLTDTFLCDRYLISGWYRFLDGRIPTSCIEPFRCGTQAPIWMNGTIPNPQDGIVIRNACVNARTGTEFAGSCCSVTIPIEVRNCGEFVVYYLRRSPGCPMAYCVESAPVLQATPRLIGPEIIGDRFRFACQIDFTAGSNDVAFDVSWSFDNQPIRGMLPETITGTNRVLYLDEQHWIGNVGKTLRCHTRTYHHSMPSVKSPSQESNGYWGGITVTPNSITVSESGDEQEINVTCTLPILCQHDGECAIHLTMDVEGRSWEDIATTRDCRLRLNREDWNPVRRSAMTATGILATRDFIDDGDQELIVNFSPDYTSAPQLWHGYSFPGAKVVTLDGVTSRCYAFSDPHIRGLERSGVYHLYEAGDFVFVRNKRRPFEVHIRSWPCVGRGCICAVAIREGNDLITIDICDNTGNIPAKLRILSGSEVAPGTKIQRSRDGQTFMISFESGNWLRIKDFRSYLNVEVQATSRDYGSLEGICGTFDNNVRNEFLSPSGMLYADSDLPVDFLRSWRIARERSLFTGQFRRFSIQTQPQPNYMVPNQCTCKSSSGLVECGATKSIQDPNRLTIANYVDITVSVSNNVDGDEEDRAPSFNREQVMPQMGHIPTTILTESQAMGLCSQSIVNISLGVDCSSVLNIHMSGFMSACVQDTMLAGSDFFVKGMVAAFEVNCQEAVLKNVSNYEKDDEGRRVPPPAVSSMMCPNQCSLRGRCGDGVCRCNSGYTGDDCSVESNIPPEIVQIRRNGICDASQRQCEEVPLIVDNFMETPDTVCQIRKVKEVNGILVPNETRQTIPANFQSNREVTCQLPGTNFPQDTAVDRKLVSISTDGTRFSNEKLHTVFDSNCLQCYGGGNCSQKMQTCLIGDKCWKGDDVNPRNEAEICNPTVNKIQWTLKVPVITQNDELDMQTCDCKNESMKIYDRWDIWTSNSTGCACDSSDSIGECACCEVGACRCPSPNQNQCAQCGKESTDCTKKQFSPEFGIDAWTRRLDGCQCPFKPSQYDCACCQNEACHCGAAYRNQCAPCFYPELCGSKPDVFGRA